MFPGGKGDRCVGLTTVPLSCADCLEIWELNLLEPLGPVQACNGIKKKALCNNLFNEWTVFVYVASQSN
jgi:hypothetical protein